MSDQRKLGVMGGGAVGSYYGGLLAKSGVSVTMVGRPRHVDAIRAQGGVRVTSRDFDFVAPVKASIEISALEECDLILLTTKTGDTEFVAGQLAHVLSSDACVLVFQNGIDGADRAAAHIKGLVVPAVLFVSCQMESPGHVHHNGRGDIVLGDRDPSAPGARERREKLDDSAAMFRAASVHATVEDDIRPTQWSKLAMNCAYNALSALGRSRYERLVANEASRSIMRQVTEELVATAHADGVPLDLETTVRRVMDLASGVPQAISSTAQDITARRLTEIDDLNGFVVRRATALGVPVPVNATLVRLVRLLEAAPFDPAFFPQKS